MSDIDGFETGVKNMPKQACRVAYTLNNSQPVTSTIIGDQPLFYMDFDVDYSDEEMDILDLSEFGLFEEELAALKHEIEGLDRFSEEFAQSPQERFQIFLDDKEEITEPFTLEKKQDLEALTNALSESRLAQAYLDCAKEHNVEIIYSAQISEAEYDRVSGTISLNPNIAFVDQILLAGRELRRHWQHRQGALINPLTFHPDSGVLINRIQVADLTVAMIRIAWELQLSGQKDVWERIENSPLADLGRTFARESFIDFRSLNNGQASTAVFEAWFLSERPRCEDKNLIQKMLADYKGYVFDQEESETSITPALIAALGEVPFGKNYLAPYAMTIMEDPIFSDIRDRSNANFLWFIKFERSFRETEQELQSHSEPTTGDIRFPEAQQTQDQNDGDHQSADIVSLYEDEGDNSSDSEKILQPKGQGQRTNKKNSADIIYLRRWSGE